MEISTQAHYLLKSNFCDYLHILSNTHLRDQSAVVILAVVIPSIEALGDIPRLVWGRQLVGLRLMVQESREVHVVHKTFTVLTPAIGTQRVRDCQCFLLVYT